jgi:hypothetical protein
MSLVAIAACAMPQDPGHVPKQLDPERASCSITPGCFGTLRPEGELVFTIAGPVHTELPTLELVTPWGTKSVATRITNKYQVDTWSFAVDWNTDSLDPAMPEGRARIAQPWQLNSDTIGLVAMWKPGARDVARAGELIAQATSRVIVGDTPARVTSAGFTIDEQGLVVGGTATVRIGVENTGGSTAVDVTVKSRSSLPQLHNLSFAFGNLRPGKQAAKSVTVTLPAKTPGDSATVVLTFGEAGGHEPPDLTQKLAFKKALCPDGRYSRERYDKKRAKLQQALDAGSMTQGEFDAYDAELVRCLD